MYMDFKEILVNTRKTTLNAHMANLEKDSEYNFVYDEEISKAMVKKRIIHQMSYIRKYLVAESEMLITHEACTSFFSKFGKTLPYIQECIEGIIRTAQLKTYNLYKKFDNDIFRSLHMPVNEGLFQESYWDDTSGVNDWRTILDDMINIIRIDFLSQVDYMKSDSTKMDREEFILDQKYVAYYCDKTKDEISNKRTRMAEDKIFKLKKTKPDPT